MYYMGSIRLAGNTYLHLKQLNLILSALDNKISIFSIFHQLISVYSII